MKRKMIFAVMCIVGVMMMAATCFAGEGHFQKIYEETLGMHDLAQDEAVSKDFTINEGKLVIQIRKLRNEGNDKKYHLLVKLKDKRIADEYFPTVDGGYVFKVFKNTATNDLFFAMSSFERAWLKGYSSYNKAYVTYADSQNYRSDFPSVPIFSALQDGNLVLALVSKDRRENPRWHEYLFVWDEESHWLSYSDEGVRYDRLNDISQ